MRQITRQNEDAVAAELGQAILDREEIPSVVLKRLIEEVRTEALEPATVYNRVHNRHNRGGF